MVNCYCRIFSPEIPADVIVTVGEADFSLHKVPKFFTFARNFINSSYIREFVY